MAKTNKTEESQELLANEPVCLEVTVSASAGGKVAINDYGKRSSDWSVFMSEKFQIPPGWTQEQVDAFLDEKYQALYEKVDAIDTREHDIRWEQKQW